MITTAQDAFDALLTLCVSEVGENGKCTLTGDQALSLADQFNRYLETNGHAPAQFSRLKAVRKAVVEA